MKTITTIIFLALTLVTYVYGQNSELETPDSLSAIKLDFEILDSNAINRKQPLRNILFPNIVTYHSEDGVKLAYYTTDNNKWTSFFLPFSDLTNDFDLVNLDRSGQPELIVIGEDKNYGSGGGTGVTGIVILNVDSIPIQIFKVYYSCFEESFGDRQNYGEGNYFKKYERYLRIKANGIIILPLEKDKYPFSECNLTEIPPGIYVMDNGKIIKK